MIDRATDDLHSFAHSSPEEGSGVVFELLPDAGVIPLVLRDRVGV